MKTILLTDKIMRYLSKYSGSNQNRTVTACYFGFQVRRGAGVLANSRRIGPELSRRVFLLLTSEDGDLPVK